MTRAGRTRVALAAAFVAAAALVAGAEARAQVRLEVLPVFGLECVAREGPTELVVGVTNPGGAPVAGVVRLESASGAFGAGVRTVPAVRYAVAPRSRAVLRVATAPTGVAAGDVVLRAEDAAGRQIAQHAIAPGPLVDAVLLDATPQARLAYALRAVTNPDPNAPPVAAGPLSALPATGLTPCPAMRVPQTGEVVLPRTRGGYSGVAAVVIDASSVIGLPLAERTALADYVMAGGTLVLLPGRPDELRHPTLAAFVGAGVRGVSPPPVDPTGGQWLAAPTGAAAGSFPAVATLQGVLSYAGGHLHTRVLGPMFPWGARELLGATADYGHGQVHALSFNPTMPPALEDPWAVSVVTRLAQRTAGARNAFRVRDTEGAAPPPPAVKRALDPNEGFRSGLGLAVVLLLVYAVVAGPLTFRLAARRGRPVRALAWLPLWSAVAFGGLVALGYVSRGVQGRARRVTVVEVPAGMTRGPMRRFRGFFAGEGGGVEVAARGHDVRLYADPAAGTGYATLFLERDRAVLRGLGLAPWTTAVVREEGFETLDGTVTLQPDLSARVRVVNRLPRRLRDVIVVAPGGAEAWYFRELRAGEARLATAGIAVSPPALAALTNAAPPLPGLAASASWHPGLQVASLFGGGDDDVRLWDAVLAAVPGVGGHATAEPVLVARIDRPVTAERDGGLRVERDDTVLRVVGWGGAP